MTKQNLNALILFGRVPTIVREKVDRYYAGLPWKDIHTLFTAFVGDVLMTASHLEGTDVMVYRNPEEFTNGYFDPFRHMVQLFELTARPFADQVGKAVDHAFRMNYARVVVLLENNPTLSARFINMVFGQLGYDDDCAVVCPTQQGHIALLGLNTNHNKIFDTSSSDPITRPSILLQRLCAFDVDIFLAQTSRSIDSTTGLASLHQAIEQLDQTSPYFPAQSSKVFSTLEKKYSKKRGTR